MLEMEPLTWHEARSHLKTLIESFVKDENSQKVRNDFSSSTSIGFKSQIHPLSWSSWDLDVYIGVIGASVSLLLPILVETERFGGANKGEVPSDIHYSEAQVIASYILLSVLLLNLFMLYRLRRNSGLEEIERLKRRVASNFLKQLAEEERWCFSEKDPNPYNTKANPVSFSGTSLTGVYPVLRRPSEASNRAVWSRIPSVLLVSGDYIALQIGDTIPATCKPVESVSSDVCFVAGEKITPTLLRNAGLSFADNLPRGRTVMESDSEDLLHFCNDMRVFVVVESPLTTLFRESAGKGREPRLMRQLRIFRAALSIVCLTSCLTSILVLGMRGLLHDSGHAWSFTFLSSTLSIPAVCPSLLLLLESLGTARIVSTYHPFVIRQQSEKLNSASSPTTIFLFHSVRTILSRLGLGWLERIIEASSKCHVTRTARSGLSTTVPIPPASLHLLARLGVATAFVLVDDELVCEDGAVPQQLLIPSGKGLKLLDICPSYDETYYEDTYSSSLDGSNRSGAPDSDSDSEAASERNHYVHGHGQGQRRRRQKIGLERLENGYDNLSDQTVQFEDPLWWHHLPSLKCIGLACLIVDKMLDQNDTRVEILSSPNQRFEDKVSMTESEFVDHWKRSLVRFVSKERKSKDMLALARCIGFSDELEVSSETTSSESSPFVEVNRFHVVKSSNALERLQLDAHERDSEQTRSWGHLRPDSTSVIIQDSRSGSFQLLTVGDPRCVLQNCHESWQGENSTILPLSSHDRSMILASTNSWKLGDLSVKAFSYTPIPYTFELNTSARQHSVVLLENDEETLSSIHNNKEKYSKEWQLMHNQIFLGVLGSCTVPRHWSQGLLSTLQQAGVRFVFMSPRNMRLTKEIASQMGIDIAWNAAISLRPLEDGEEDKHRMISNYADWDINAKLPHGIESVRRHLREVDNVPLLVSIYTDTNLKSTREMIEIFQEHGDCVVVAGISHLPWNAGTFATADLAIGVDFWVEQSGGVTEHSFTYDAVLPSEVGFVSSIAAHRCAFRLKGVDELAHFPAILASGRVSLDAVVAAALFLFVSFISLSLFLFFSTCSLLVVLPVPDMLWLFLTLQCFLPVLGISLIMGEPDKQYMRRVPPKNHLTMAFDRREGPTILTMTILKAIPIALFPQLLFPIVFGEYLILSENELVVDICGWQGGSWLSIVSCKELLGYNGPARHNAVTVTFGLFLLCICFASSGFVHRAVSMRIERPWKKNKVWAVTFVTMSCLVVSGSVGAAGLQTFSVFPWYASVLVVLSPPLCILWIEFLKRREAAILNRNEKLRRLQFETRLGMWSPK